MSILNPGPDFIYLSPGPDFIKLVRVRILSILSPGPDHIKAVRKASSGPDFYKFVSPGPDFYPSSPGRGPDFIYFWVRVRVWILSNMSDSASGSGFYQHHSRPI